VEQIRTWSENPDRAHEITLQHSSKVRPDWDRVRIQMVRSIRHAVKLSGLTSTEYRNQIDEVLWSKFAQYPTLLQELLATDAEIINVGS
jgi:predicted NAD-dependent protein-ADP-ribosyltransferase YbiA (DUF1768 family)